MYPMSSSTPYMRSSKVGESASKIPYYTRLQVIESKHLHYLSAWLIKSEIREDWTQTDFPIRLHLPIENTGVL